jgi:single-strand DNA-binding protein
MQYNDKGNAITNLTVAVDTGFGDKKETVWMSLVAFGAQAEAINKYFSKGNRIVFSADLQKVRTYEKTGGATGVNIDARLLTFAFVDKNEGSQEPEEF